MVINLQTADVDSIISNPVAIGAAGVVVGAGLGAGAVALSSRSKSRSNIKRKKITHTKRGLKQDRSRRSKQKWEVAYQRRKKMKSKRSKSRKGVKYTKNGQPYIILSSGKARFIKKTKRRNK